MIYELVNSEMSREVVTSDVTSGYTTPLAHEQLAIEVLQIPTDLIVRRSSL